MPITDINFKRLNVARIDFSKVAGHNKIGIVLEERLDFKKGSTQLLIALRTYSHTEPLIKDIKIGLGNVPFPTLDPIRDGLVPFEDEKLSYKITCDKNQFESTSTNSITIYVPTPLGEGVPDIKNSTQVYIKE